MKQNNQVANFIFGPGGGLTGARVEPTSQLYNPDRNNFAPRFGFAYSPKRYGLARQTRASRRRRHLLQPHSGNGLLKHARQSAVLRALLDLLRHCRRRTWLAFRGGQILYTLGTSSSPFSYPANPALAVGIDPGNRHAAESHGRDLRRAVPTRRRPTSTPIRSKSSMRCRFKLTATVGYQGSSSHKLIRLVNQRLVQPVIPANFFAFAVFIPTPDVNANYNALNARLTRRFTRGFQFDVLYRWAKSIDTLSNEGPGAVTNQTFPQDLRQERGPSDFDVRHNLNVSGLWDLPFFRNRHDFVGKAFGGWQIDGILTAHTGFPWTPHTGQCVRSANSNDFVCPSRPPRYFGGALEDTSNEAFIRPGGNFPGGGLVLLRSEQSERQRCCPASDAIRSVVQDTLRWT